MTSHNLGGSISLFVNGDPSKFCGASLGFVNLLEWLAALGNAQGMQEWAADSEAARMLAGRLRNDHA